MASEKIEFLAEEMDRLRTDRETLRSLPWPAEVQGELDRLVEDLEAQRLRVGRAAVLTLVGSTGAGKSTLLNALVGKAIAEPGEARPTTRQPVVYAPEDADVSEWLADLPGPAPRVERYRPSALGTWSGQIVIDAPDTNSVETSHRAVVQALAERSDVLVVLAHRQSVVEESTVRFLESFAQMRGLVLALGHGDRLSAANRRELAQQLESLARERFGWRGERVHVLSPLEALEDPQSQGWPEFCAELHSVAQAGQLRRIRRYNALGSAGRIAQWVARARPQLDGQWEALEREVAQATRDLPARVLEEVSRRLDLRQSDLETLLWDEVGRRWIGPGGLALRAGGMTSLGLGAGAWLARRNPLLAAGAAAGALVTSKWQSRQREQSVRGGEAWLPSPGEWTRWYEAALAPVRLAASTAEREAAPWPSGEELQAEFQAAVEDALSDLMDRELPGQAEQAARSPLRWAVDLPVYAFALWIIVRSAIGFYEGAYVGMDFLVNAALLAGAWLWLGRTVARRWLRSRAGRLVQWVRARIEARFAQVMDVALGPLQRRLTEQREAVHRMCRLEATWRAKLEEPGDSAPRDRVANGSDAPSSAPLS